MCTKPICIRKSFWEKLHIYIWYIILYLPVCNWKFTSDCTLQCFKAQSSHAHKEHNQKAIWPNVPHSEVTLVLFWVNYTIIVTEIDDVDVFVTILKLYYLMKYEILTFT